MKTSTTYSQIARKTADERTPAEREKIRAVWRDKMAKRRARARSGEHPTATLDAFLVTELRATGTQNVIRSLEIALLSWAQEEPSARVRERLLEETRMVSRLVATLTEPDEITSAPRRGSA